MSYFSDLLDSCIHDSGLSVNDLSRISGINRTYISKLRSGSRIMHNEEKMHLLIKALRCSSEQEEQLIREYKIAAFGRERYDTIQAVKELIQSIAYLPNMPYIKPHTGDADFPNTICGKNDINFVMQTILAQEAALEAGHIRIIAQQEFEDLASILPNICYKNEGLHVEHITCLRSSKVQGANLYNLNCMKRCIPSILCGCKYDLLYYYGEQSHINNMSIFPYLIVTANYAMSISYDGDSAILHNDSKMIDAMVKVFNDIKAGCRPIISNLTLNARLEMYNKWYEGRGSHDVTVLAMSNCPAFTPYVTMDILERSLTDVGRASTETIKQMLQLFKQDFAKRIIKFFSMDGLNEFVRKGRISGIPDILYNPLSMADRLELVRQWRERCNHDDFINMAVQPGQMQISDNIYIEALNVGNVVLSYTHPMHKDAFCVILEESIAGSIHDFLTYLNGGNMAYSEEDTLAAVDELIKMLEEETSSAGSM